MSNVTETTTTTIAPTCPPWCYPERHSDDAEADGTITRYHRSQSTEVSGFGVLTVVQCVRAARVDPVTVSVDPGGWAELERREEARDFAVAVDRALREMITLAWPEPGADEINGGAK